MKIQVIVAGCCLLLAAEARAQQWCAPGAMWEYQIIGFAYEGAGIDTYVGDTVIAGRASQRIAFHRTGYDYIGNTADTLVGEWYTSYEDGVVYTYLTVSQEWDTLYWLGAVPGDRWYAPDVYIDPTQCPPPAGMAEVVDTGRVDVNGVLLRYVDVQGYGPSGELSEEVLRIHERFGTQTLRLMAGYCFNYDGGYRLCRYTDDIGTVYDPDYGQCVDPSGIRETGAGGLLHLHPNPTTGSLTVELRGQVEARELTVFDATGRLMLSRSIENAASRITVDMSGHESGVYLVQVLFPDGTRAVQQVVLQ